MKSEQLNLAIIAAHLEAFEETIIYKLIDRAQYCENLRIYQTGMSGFTGEPQRCLFDIRLRYQEEMDSRFGRFCVPEERSFTKELPTPLRQVAVTETELAIDDFDKINVTDEILKTYFKLVPELCKSGDDGNYGSSVEHDVYAIQAIARRVHYGSLYVAESKFRDNPDAFENIHTNEMDKIIKLLTRTDVEERIINRVREKTYSAQVCINHTLRYYVDPEIIAEFYCNAIIPLTKKGEFLYLLNRRKC